MRSTTATNWQLNSHIRHSDSGYEIAVVAEAADLCAGMPLSKPIAPVAWVRVERPVRGPANIDLLHATARLVAGAPAMRRALHMAMSSGALAGDAEAQQAAREALAVVEG